MLCVGSVGATWAGVAVGRPVVHKMPEGVRDPLELLGGGPMHRHVLRKGAPPAPAGQSPGHVQAWTACGNRGGMACTRSWSARIFL